MRLSLRRRRCVRKRAEGGVANSISGGNCGGLITDGGHNIDDGTACGFTGTGCTNTSGTSFCNSNPVLDPAGLANNGGPTETIALETGSPAINAGDETVCAAPPVNNLDQRGFGRPGAGATNCSIGAYEFNASPSPTTTTTTTTTTTLASAACGLSASDLQTKRTAYNAACTARGEGCANAPNHGTYVSCIAHQAKADATLPKPCPRAVIKCAAHSTCGKPGFVTCCQTRTVTDVTKTKCRVKATAAACKQPKSGAACVGTHPSCCDACTSSCGCASPSEAFLDESAF